MHIPDGFLDVKTAAASGLLAAAGLGLALRQAQRALPPGKVPLLGLSAAFVFAAQMLNFPVAGGTSGHLIGGVLAAVLLGPAAAVIVISSVLFVQCFLFADGGMTALGANVFNMAVVGAAGGWMVYALLARLTRSQRGGIGAAAVAGWASTVLAATACAGELAASGTAAWRVVFPAMAGVHALIGVGEGIITALVLSAVARARPELMRDEAPPERAWGTAVALGLLISVGLALFVAPFASPLPDGLDKTAVALGFEEKASEHAPPTAVEADYRMPGIASERLATGVAGVAGTVVVFAVGWMAARAMAGRRSAAAAR